MFYQSLPALLTVTLFLGIASKAGAATITPDGLNPGDEFRLVFVTSVRGPATSTGISDYDDFVTQRAVAADLTTYNGNPVTWQVLGSTASVSAISRLPLNSPALYLVTGTKVADTGADLWDGSIDAAINRDEFGVLRGVSAFTGTLTNGLTSTLPLGHYATTKGFSNFTTELWVGGDSQSTGGGEGNYLSFYGYSSVLTVPDVTPVPEPAGLSLLLMGGSSMICVRTFRRRRARCSD